jgi:hypothetical protein
MNFRDANQDSTEVKYISKRVMINGQLVTLYSANGQTWLSSPEDIPALMERLDSARVTLNTAEKVAEGEAAKVAEPEAKTKSDDKGKKEPQPEAPERALSAKYRMKGPKPRPILRQDGVVIKGTPIEPISASATVMSFSSDVKNGEEGKASDKVAKGTKSSKIKETKLIAPIVSKKVAKPAAKPVVAPSKGAGKAASKSVAASAVAKSKGAKQLPKAVKPIKQTASVKLVSQKQAKKALAPKVAGKPKAATSKSVKTAKKAVSKAKKSKK